MRTNEEIDSGLDSYFAIIKDQPARDPQKAARGRAVYLAQAQEAAKTILVVETSPMGQDIPAVSIKENRRHNRWMHALQSIFAIHRKEQSPMFSALSTILLIASLVLGGSGITVAAAQASQPDEGLYPVKTWSEDIRAGLAANEQARLRLAMEFSNRRGEEIRAMLQAGKVPPDAVPARMQSEIDHALEMASGQASQQAVKSLEEIRDQLRSQEQAFGHLPSPAGTSAEALLARTRAMLQDRLRLCEDGLKNPEALHKHLRPGEHPDQPIPMPSKTVPVHPRAIGTRTPASGHGPGPDDRDHAPITGTLTPGSGHDPATGDNDGHHWATGTPTPGSGYGPGPGPGGGECSDCGENGGTHPSNGSGGDTGHDEGSGGGTGSSHDDGGSGGSSGGGHDGGGGKNH